MKILKEKTRLELRPLLSMRTLTTGTKMGLQKMKVTMLKRMKEWEHFLLHTIIFLKMTMKNLMKQEDRNINVLILDPILNSLTCVAD